MSDGRRLSTSRFNIGMESDRGRVDHDVGFPRNFVSAPLNGEFGLSLGLSVEQINKGAGSAFAAVHHRNARDIRQCELHPNRPCSPARAEQNVRQPAMAHD